MKKNLQYIAIVFSIVLSGCNRSPEEELDYGNEFSDMGEVEHVVDNNISVIFHKKFDTEKYELKIAYFDRKTNKKVKEFDFLIVDTLGDDELLYSINGGGLTVKPIYNANTQCYTTEMDITIAYAKDNKLFETKDITVDQTNDGYPFIYCIDK